MRIVSWNVNGIRAIHKKGNAEFLRTVGADIIALQETKADVEQVHEELRALPDYHAYFSSSKVKKGYSGVAVYTKREPEAARNGIGTPRFDDEGRIIELDFGTFVFWNVYFPNGGMGPHRLEYKLDFYDAFLERIETVRAEGKSVIFCGDVNTAHEEIDLARPKENETNTGFLPEERAWLDELANLGYVDTFRHFYPDKRGAYTYWDLLTGARDRNVGWRIDYVFVSADLVGKLKGAGIMPEVYGSDHCPIYADIDV